MAETMAVPFTPGPWKAELTTEENDASVSFGEDGDYGCICSLDLSSWDGDTNDANARLIAAAPELYAALSTLLAHSEGLLRAAGTKAETDAVLVMLTTAWAALAKARGEEPKPWE